MAPDTTPAAPPAEVSTHVELLTSGPAEALAGLLDIDPPPLRGGAAIPPLWHWVYLLERCRQSELGADGHPARGIPAPPGPGRLRMFAGGRVTTHHCLRIGETATRTTRVAAIVDKAGRSGPLTFVTVRTDIVQGGVLAIGEEQDIVYRASGSTLPARARTASQPDPDAATGSTLQFDVDPVVLFRFSALTYNSHRIHYDRAYTTEEGYPDLVVHGPLQALLMGELSRRRGVPILGRQFSYRFVAPTFGRQRLTVMAGEGDTVAAQVRDTSGQITAVSTLGR